MKTITGRYEKDQNFTTVFVEEEKTMYTIARNSGEYGYRKVGDRLASGYLFTQDMFDRWSSECGRAGTFILED